MAKDFLKKLALGVAIALVSTATVAAVSALAKKIQGDDEAGAEDSSVKYCTHAGVIEIPGVAPSCLEGGATDGSICASCGGIIEQQIYLEPTGHTKVVVPAVEATCKDEGLTEGMKCGVCGEVLVSQKTLPKVDCVDGDLNGLCDFCFEKLPEGIMLLRQIASAENVVETQVVEGTICSAGTVVRIYHGSAGIASNWIFVGTEMIRFARSYMNEVFVEEGFIEPLYNHLDGRFEGEIYAYVTETYIDYYIGPGIIYDTLGEVLYDMTDGFVIAECGGPGADKTCIITLAEV